MSNQFDSLLALFRYLSKEYLSKNSNLLNLVLIRLILDFHSSLSTKSENLDFRPKSIFPRLVFEYNNMNYACQKCNQNKLDNIANTMGKIAQMQAVVQKTLKEGHDFGEVPGTNKPTLLKPGGEKICMLFGLNPEYDFLQTTEDYDKEFFSYNIKCTLFRNGQAVAQGVGSCNSKEKKSIRSAYGKTLVELGAINENIVALDADLSCSTQTKVFADAFPDRFFNCGDRKSVV